MSGSLSKAWNRLRGLLRPPHSPGVSEDMAALTSSLASLPELLAGVRAELVAGGKAEDPHVKELLAGLDRIEPAPAPRPRPSPQPAPAPQPEGTPATPPAPQAVGARPRSPHVEPTAITTRPKAKSPHDLFPANGGALPGNRAAELTEWVNKATDAVRRARDQMPPEGHPDYEGTEELRDLMDEVLAHTEDEPPSR
jgi:hypothetical protein